MTWIKKIITHGGKAHRDEVLACSVVLFLAGEDIPIERRDPTEEELADPDVWVIDVGMDHNASLHNFDHHQWTCDKEHGDPRCALSLVLEYFGYRDLWTSMYSWLPLTEILDVHGPKQASESLGMSVENFFKTNSPLEKGVLKWFEQIEDCNQWRVRDPGLCPSIDPETRPRNFDEGLFDFLREIGEGLVERPNEYEQRLTWLEQFAKIRQVPGQEYYYIRVPHPCGAALDNPSLALDQFRCQHQEETGQVIVVSVSPDPRGPGCVLFRFDDDPRVDFCRLEGHPDVDFVHTNGFLATTPSRDKFILDRLVAVGCDSGGL